MDAGKRPRLYLSCGANHFRHFTPGSPAAELNLVEEQVSGSLAVLRRQCGEGLLGGMKLHHAPEVDGADDIDIVQNERLFNAGVKTSSREISIRMPKLSLAFR